MSNPFASPESIEQNLGNSNRSITRLKRVGVVSSGILMGAGGAVMGLLAGGIFFLISLAGVGAAANAGNGPDPAAAFIGMGVGAIFILPIMYGIGGFIAGIIYAFIYNVLAGMTGGLEMEFGRD